MPTNKANTMKPTMITRPHGDVLLRMGPPPVPGRAVTAGKCVAVGAAVVAVGAPVVAVGAPVVAVGAPVVAVGAPVVAVGCAEQFGPVMTLESRVTAPVCARARPSRLALVFRAMDVRARMFPMKEVVVSIVAELPTRHHTLHGSPPETDEPGDVMSVDADLKIHTPDPLSVRFPVSVKAVAQ